MQTFLPYPDFEKSAKCLDKMRLGKQRVEAWQLYLSLTQENYGWKSHPASKMWEGYEGALLVYGLLICIEWRNRGYKDTLLVKFTNELNNKTINTKIFAGKDSKHILSFKFRDTSFYAPNWLGNEPFHASHRSNLLKKGYQDGLWVELLAYEKRNPNEAWIQEFPYSKTDMTSSLYEQLHRKIGAQKNHYEQFNWVEPMTLEYVWPV